MEQGVLLKFNEDVDGDCICKWVVKEYRDGDWVVCKSNKFSICQLVEKLQLLQSQGYQIEYETDYTLTPTMMSEGVC